MLVYQRVIINPVPGAATAYAKAPTPVLWICCIGRSRRAAPLPQPPSALPAPSSATTCLPARDFLGGIHGDLLLGFIGICWDLLGFIGICWDLLGFVGMCWDYWDGLSLEIQWTTMVIMGF